MQNFIKIMEGMTLHPSVNPSIISYNANGITLAEVHYNNSNIINAMFSTPLGTVWIRLCDLPEYNLIHPSIFVNNLGHIVDTIAQKNIQYTKTDDGRWLAKLSVLDSSKAFYTLVDFVVAEVIATVFSYHPNHFINMKVQYADGNKDNLNASNLSFVDNVTYNNNGLSILRNPIVPKNKKK